MEEGWIFSGLSLVSFEMCRWHQMQNKHISANIHKEGDTNPNLLGISVVLL